MIADLQVFMFFVASALAVYHLVPRTFPNARITVLLIFSFIVIFYISEYALLACLILAMAFLSFRYFLLKVPQYAFHFAWISTLIVVALLVLIAFPLLSNSTAAFVGVSYSSLKVLSAIWDYYRLHQDGLPLPPVRSALLQQSFFPIYSAGPIERVASFDTSIFSKPFDFSLASSGLQRILVGIFKVALISNSLLDPVSQIHFANIWSANDATSPLAAWLFVSIRFLSLYVNFSGYSDIAIGASALFNIKVRENFNSPLLATSLQDFWQRWHLSLASFINAYIFWPLARVTKGRIELSIFVAFVIAGMWHNINYQYLFWGIMHGAGLAFVFRWQRFVRASPELQTYTSTVYFNILGRTATLAYVAWLSTFANSPSLQDGVSLSLKMLGLYHG